MAGPGDVLVIYNGSNYVAPWGGLATLSSKNKGIEGVVVDGAVRDVDEIRALNYPIFSSGITPNASDPKGKGEINCRDHLWRPDGAARRLHCGRRERSRSHTQRESLRDRQESQRGGEDGKQAL